MIKNVNNEREMVLQPIIKYWLGINTKKSPYLILESENLSISWWDFFVLGKLASKTQENSAVFVEMGIK